MASHNYFAKVKQSVYANKSMRLSDFRLLLSMLAMSTKDGKCWTNMAGFMSDSGLSKSSAYDAKEHLESMGYITKKDGEYWVAKPALHSPVHRNSESDTPELKSDTPDSKVRPAGQTLYLIEEEYKKNKEEYPGFDIFYSAYPKKRKKPDALRAFKKHFNSLPPLPDLITIIEKWKRTEEWTKEDGKFIPYPASWLNAQGWEDDLPSLQETEDEKYKRIYG